MSAIGDDASAHFVEKWQRREPEMLIAEVFCPAAEKNRFRAWGALLHELRETLFELSDPRVSALKAAWWAEELTGLAQGRQRHPLSAALLGIDAPWAALGRSLVEFGEQTPRAADTAQAIALLAPAATAVTAVEAAVFGFAQSDQAARSLARHWLLQRMPQGLAGDDQARIPMHLLARHGINASQLASGDAGVLLRDWGRELARVTPEFLRGAAFIRRGRHQFDQARLARLAAGKGFDEPPEPASLWRAWRAARSP